MNVPTAIPTDVRRTYGWAVFGLLTELAARDLSDPIPYAELETAADKRVALKSLIAKAEEAGYLRKEMVQLGFAKGTGFRFTVYPAGDAPPTP